MKITAMQYNVVSAGILLLVTVTANAKLMFVVSIVGLLMGFNFLRNDHEQSGVLAVTIGFFFVLVMSLIIRFIK